MSKGSMCKGPTADQHTATQTTALGTIMSTKLSECSGACKHPRPLTTAGFHQVSNNIMLKDWVRV